MIDLEKVKGFTVNDHPSQFEFVFHVTGESDYRFRVMMKTEWDEVMEILKNSYTESTGKALAVYCVPAPNLKDFHTVKGDVKKGISWMPPKTSWIYDQAEESKGPDHLTGGPSSESWQWSTEGTTLYSRKEGETVCLEDFIVKRVIGKGSFGKVFLVQKRGKDDVYAMKSIRKDILLQNDQVESTKLEKEILLKAEHPFLVKMEYIFQTEQKVYFVMIFVRGGELFTHLNKVRRFPESWAKFYAA